jgi:hypothetical protein
MTCADAQGRLAIRQACVTARQDVQDVCFNVPPDPSDPAAVAANDGHIQAISAAQNRLNYCQDAVNALCTDAGP